ncbi:MAG: TIGR02300 family protein [Magnetospirillum sp. WYHS-4]
MASPDLGTKRTCPSCGARFYDLKKNPATCPKCGAKVKADTTAKFRRGKPLEEDVKPKREAAAPSVAPDLLAAEGAELEATEELADAEEDEELIEDASDLGEDDDDVSEVMEHLDEDELGDKP